MNDWSQGLRAESANRLFWEIGEVAKLAESNLGGPVRTIVDGRHSKPTGHMSFKKAEKWRMPFESLLEVNAMYLAEVSSRVFRILAQPHTLYFKPHGHARVPYYTPDLLAEVDETMYEDLLNGVLFSSAALAFSMSFGSSSERKTAVFEVKQDIDDSDDNVEYKSKLKIAEQVYGMLGYHFAILRPSKGLALDDSRLASQIRRYAKTPTNDRDEWLLIGHMALTHGSTTFGALQNALGGGVVGRNKVLSYHVKRRVQVDISSFPTDQSAVIYSTGDQFKWASA